MNSNLLTRTLFVLAVITSIATSIGKTASIDIQTFEQQFFHSNLTDFPFPDIYPINPIPIAVSTGTSPSRAISKKPWTFMVYIAADNDLRAFAANNIKQMASVGSNKNINIVIHLDIRLNGNQKITRRYYIDKNKITPMDNRPEMQRMDSGDTKTLVSFCEWAIKHYPANDYAVILWNHGTGIIDPKNYKILNPAELFTFNPATHKLDINRSIGFLDIVSYSDMENRGICMDSTTGNYLTNQKLELAFHEIHTKLLQNKKLSIIGFDACLMSMLEVANIFKRYAKIMVGSQEVELGTGWNYARILQPFVTHNIDRKTFAQHIVTSYKNSYQQVTNDYTQSAINLSSIDHIEQNINSVARLLIACLANQKDNSVKKAIMASRNKKICTSFDEPSYTDLLHLYRNIRTNLSKFTFKNQSHNNLIQELNQTLIKGESLVLSAVLSNVAGKNLQMAQGISIYFPENQIHPSYLKTNFAKNNAWPSFLSRYLS